MAPMSASSLVPMSLLIFQLLDFPELDLYLFVDLGEVLLDVAHHASDLPLEVTDHLAKIFSSSSFL
jgi:hypothetical protein